MHPVSLRLWIDPSRERREINDGDREAAQSWIISRRILSGVIEEYLDGSSGPFLYSSNGGAAPEVQIYTFSGKAALINILVETKHSPEQRSCWFDFTGRRVAIRRVPRVGDGEFQMLDRDRQSMVEIAAEAREESVQPAGDAKVNNADSAAHADASTTNNEIAASFTSTPVAIFGALGLIVAGFLLRIGWRFLSGVAIASPLIPFWLD
jgi:hypothetical protein